MKTCFFTLSHKTGILMADIIPYAGSHDTRLGRESSWPQAPSGIHFFQAADGQGAFLRRDRSSGVLFRGNVENTSTGILNASTRPRPTCATAQGRRSVMRPRSWFTASAT